MKLFSKEEVNTGRQFEFDLAKAICILGMVFVHCFEEFPLTESGYSSSLYYTFVVVLDALFGAGTFMICLGIGLAYTKKNEPNDFIKRGITTFLLGYLLNVFRFVIPFSAYFLQGDFVDVLKYLVCCLLYTDIMQFAGLAFLLFGLLKKIKVPDWGIAVIAIVMSIVGTFVRLIDLGNVFVDELGGLLFGTHDPAMTYDYYYAPFPLTNWFILVIFGYFFAKLLRKTQNIEKFYAITTISSAVIVITYMVIAIPNRLGMMSGDITDYFQMRIWDSLMIMSGAVFAFGIYHYISKLFGEKLKNVVTKLSSNINKTYCIHWVIIGFLTFIFWALFEEGLKSYIILLVSLAVYIVSSLIPELMHRIKERKKAKENVTESQNN